MVASNARLIAKGAGGAQLAAALKQALARGAHCKQTEEAAGGRSNRLGAGPSNKELLLVLLVVCHLEQSQQQQACMHCLLTSSPHHRSRCQMVSQCPWWSCHWGRLCMHPLQSWPQ
jgi:hypothetical protein